MVGEWDRAEHPKGSCNACGRIQRVVMGDRGPVKVALEMQVIGHFRFCWDCLAGARFYRQSTLTWIAITSGSASGELWLVNASSSGTRP